MKHLVALIFLSFLMPRLAVGQINLVANGSFEQMQLCPSNWAQIANAIGWHTYNAATPDYFNSCFVPGQSQVQNVGVPSNHFGSQLAADGAGYAGIITHADTANFEYLTRAMTAMQPGLLYEVSMSVSRGDLSTNATDNLGVLFRTSTFAYNTLTFLPVQPQVHYGSYGIISDTVNWVRLRKTFLADSAYNNIVIGGFNNPQSTYNIDTTKPNTTVHKNYAYYYIDSVVVTLLDSLWFNFDDNNLCAGDTIKVPYFVIKDKKPNNIFTLQLSDGNGSFSSPVNIGSIASDTSDTITAVIPVNTATGIGYRLRIQASSFSDTSNEGIQLKIAAPIVKPIAVNNGPYCITDTIQLSATSTTQGISYNWTGPGNFSSNQQQPIILSALSGNTGDYIFTARLYGCEAKDTTTVLVNQGPIGTLATTNAPVCEGDTMRLFGTANGTGITYSWKGPNNFTANTQNIAIPVSTIPMSGIYELYAYNGLCTSIDIVSANVKPRPANFTATSNSPVCAGQNINFTGSSTSTGVVYAWTGPNGFNSALAAPQIGGVSSIHQGDYYVTATLNGCPLKDTVTTAVKPLPVKPVATSNSPLCVGQTLNLTAASTTGGVAYQWTGPNSFATGTQNPNISNATTAISGDYIVTATLNGCVQADTATVLVKPMPTAATTSNNGPVCAGSNLQLTISNSTTGSTYTWAGPNSFAANTQTANVTNSTTAATGWYVNTIDLNGCSFKDSTYATVKPMPPAPVASYSSPLCVGEILNLSAASSGGSSYAWEGPNGFVSTQQNPTRNNMQFGDTGTYKVTATLNGCTSQQSSTSVSINTPAFVVISSNPTDSICQGAAMVFTALPNNHGGTPLYQWYINNIAVNTGSIFNTTAIANGDIIRCEMTEYTKCNAPYTDASNDITITVLPLLTPAVTIAANPNRPLSENEYVTFTATATNAGAAPTYQWKRNGQNVQGATANTWGANTLKDNDNICVEVSSSYKCPQPQTVTSNCIKLTVLSGIGDVNHNAAHIKVYPNPVKGTLRITSTEEIATITVNNLLGQQLMKHTTNRKTAEVDMSTLAAGVYVIKVNGGYTVRILKE